MTSKALPWTRRLIKFSERNPKGLPSTTVPGTSVSSTVADPPGPTGLSAIILCLSRQRDPLRELGELARKYGDIVHMQLGSRHDYLVNHPDHIKKILCAPQSEMARSTPPGLKRLLGSGLLTSQGDYHRRHKRLLAPAFHRELVRQWGSTIVTECERLRDCWQDRTELDVEYEMLRLTLAIVLKVFLRVDLKERTDEIATAANTLIQMIHCRTLPVIDDLLDKVALGRIRRFKHARDRFDTIVYRMIRERRASSSPEHDLLSALLQVQDEETGSSALTDQEIRDEVVTMLIAGHETTAHALTWTWFLLSQHPQVELKLHAELDSVLNGRLPVVDDLESLPYNRMVFSEAMRLYPPVWIVARRNPNAWSLGNYTFPPGSFIFLSQYLIQRDPRFFPDPDRFDPERWAPNAVTQRPRYSYFPFGGGPRQCLGEGLAWIIGLLVLASIGQRFQFSLVPRQQIALEPLITLRPKYGMRMIANRRFHSAG
ncbi:MAG: cytochrome P450 [Verrucomicrobia bacterium]|nr:cytochrome P450 [Verrucomicrobiota bacterium]